MPKLLLIQPGARKSSEPAGTTLYFIIIIYCLHLSVCILPVLEYIYFDRINSYLLVCKVLIVVVFTTRYNTMYKYQHSS
jgi:hypothetical protein